MDKLTDQARAYAEIDNCTHDKSFFVAYEGFKAGAEWHSREMDKHKVSPEDEIIIYIEDYVIRKGTFRELLKENKDELIATFRWFLHDIELNYKRGTPIEDVEARFDKLFKKDGR